MRQIPFEDFMGAIKTLQGRVMRNEGLKHSKNDEIDV